MAAMLKMLYQTANVSKQTLHRMRIFLSTLQPNNITFCIILPLIGFSWTFLQSLCRETFILGVTLYIMSGVGITAGKYDAASQASVIYIVG